MPINQFCSIPGCFFCIMKEQDSSLRRNAISEYLKYMPLIDDEELILVVSGIWNMAMTRPDDQELPHLGVFECMANLIRKSVDDRSWLFRNQNIYISYYAAHIIGSYTMNNAEFAIKAVESGVIPPLMELLRGKMSWVEQRVAVRALGHLASYEKTFKSVAIYEEELVKLSMNLASTCLEIVYTMFVGIKDTNKRLKYHSDLLARGVGGIDMENQKAEEWASQLQCWCIHLLNCFATKERSLDIICKQEFLEDLCEMWGGLVNHSSPAGVGLIRILCYTKVGRKCIAESRYVIVNLCSLSRSSDDWQYMGIDCLLLLLKDPETRYKIIEISTSYLIDLVELRTLAIRPNFGATITRVLLNDFRRKSKIMNANVQRELEEIWSLKVERSNREKATSDEKLEEKRVLVNLLKQEGNHRFVVGEIDEAVLQYTEAIELCPLRYTNERIVLYSNRAQCNLLLRDPDAAISDATRALCLSSPPNSHSKSLWRRSQAYDMKGMAKESLMDCIMFINGCIKSKKSPNQVKIPYYAVRMISKQMDSTWLFKASQLKKSTNLPEIEKPLCDDDESGHREQTNERIIRILKQKKSFKSGLSTILEEPLFGKGGNRGRN
ncbi:uncharacterized protein LOC111393288 [Olea europaea var. sylvestris]|uniref:uncharacterized protein LOC111393288 n=1 Tax=Olea europaea var. sylvestris TaxID=158386 RepID=UPI000C1D5FB4|nr:uncharacterized protein LOC111393288 [Olea europaea var. sylvestris]XP_022874517.1 uncharacterized protein LOC111393288 [Olea europaea var. sylvestris]XP_022874519.1 uncharacterized protein LOC111393288 [Olea europaea var. sylvestris]